MKKRIISFLFFFLVCSLLSKSKIQAQKEIDSSNYYYQLLLKPKNDSDLGRAYVYFDSSKKNNVIKKDFKKAVLDLIYIAEIQKKLGLVNESENSSIAALKLLNRLKNDNEITLSVAIYNNLGMIYRYRGDSKRALGYYDKVLKITEDPVIINSILNNRAFVYFEDENYDLAIQEFSKVHNFNIENGNREKIARSFDNLGFAQSKVKSSGVALNNLLKALEIREELNHTNGIFTSYYNLSEYYYDRGNNPKALDFARRADTISLNTQNIKQKEIALSQKLKLKGDIDFLEYLKITDSISNFERLSRDKYAALKYEKETESNRAELIKYRMERWIVISIILFLLFILIYIIQRFRHTKEKQNKIIETESRISKKIHDELANDVYSTMVQLENRSVSIPEILNELEDIYQNARDISQEKTVYKTNEEYVQDLKRILGSFTSSTTSVVVRGLNEDVWIDISEDKKVTSIRVLKELLVNMKKHSKASVASIVFSREAKELRFTYTDNGVWVSKNELINGTGLVNAENRIKAVGGRFIFDKTNRKGLKINIHIPL